MVQLFVFDPVENEPVLKESFPKGLRLMHILRGVATPQLGKLLLFY